MGSNARSGKWLFEGSPDCPEETWKKVRQAVLDGLFVAGKRSSPQLDAMPGRGGRPLVLVYVESSGCREVGEALSSLRTLGVEGPARFKTDQSTIRGIDEDLYASTDFEPFRFVADAEGGPGVGDVLEDGEGNLLRIDHLIHNDGLSAAATLLPRDRFSATQDGTFQWHFMVSCDPSARFWTGDGDAVRNLGQGCWRLDPGRLEALLVLNGADRERHAGEDGLSPRLPFG